MKKLIIPITILLASCGPNLLNKSINVETIDSCEYVIIDSQDAVALVHKQNCKYCKTRK